jgi:hypothetical protein
MRFPPADVLAAWPRPNYINPVTRGPAILIIELTILPLALLCVASRLWIRIRWLRKSWWDDWLMLVAAFWSIGTTCIVILGTSPSMNESTVHTNNIQPHNNSVGISMFGISQYP